MANVYISYNQRDRDFVAAVAEQLKAQGHVLSLDIETIMPGQDWRHTLTEGLKSSEIFIVFLSQN
ncbi:MAG: toll/interleukin-1 receptor domain-containing protein [Nitrosomonadaceae bacterium]|nr:toll/interleukin-1 receptor domain-containing protein [Nitrosomonadaceae bacterium]